MRLLRRYARSKFRVGLLLALLGAAFFAATS